MSAPRLLLLALLAIAVAPGRPCDPRLTVDISDGIAFANGSVLHAGLVYDAGLHFELNGSRRGCVCDLKPCYRKCCAPGHFMAGRHCAEPHDEEDVAAVRRFAKHVQASTDDQPHLEHFAVVVGLHCHKGRYRVNASEFRLDQEGMFRFVEGDMELKAPTDYCVELFNGSASLEALVCFLEEVDHSSFAKRVAMLISIPFLLVTFVVYAIVPELRRNLHGKSLMCYVGSLLIAFVALTVNISQMDAFDMNGCVATAFITIFFFMVSFFWLNVMCVDIWSAFSGFRGTATRSKHSEQRRFLYYNLYAWGVPLLHLGVVACFQFLPALKNLRYSPKIGDSKCWFEDDASTTIFFYLPIFLLLVFNIGLYGYTAYKIRSVKKDTSSVMKRSESQRHNYENGKQMFNLYIKLLLIMGINWTMEIISHLVGGWFVFWIVTDICNALYGVLIFVIFLCKRSVWKLLAKSYHKFMGRPRLAQDTFGNSISGTRTTSIVVNDKSLTDNGGSGGIALQRLT